MPFTEEERERVRRWAISQVEGVHLGDSSCLKLNRSEDPFTREEITILVDVIIEKDPEHQITRIWLPERGLDDTCIEQLCRLTWLIELDVIFNRLTDQSIVFIAQSLSQLRSLLISGNTDITNLKPLQTLTRLQSLVASDLPQLQMRDEDWSNLIQSTKLEFLSIEDSNGSKEARQTIRSEILNAGREPKVITDFLNDGLEDPETNDDVLLEEAKRV